MRLTVLLCGGVVELECTKSCTRHEQEGDVLNLLNVLLRLVLHKN